MLERAADTGVVHAGVVAVLWACGEEGPEKIHGAAPFVSERRGSEGKSAAQI